MKEMPIEASFDEFVELINEHTHGTVTCWACGGTDWNAFDAESTSPAKMHIIRFVCVSCGLLRLHHVNLVFPSAAEA